VLPAAPGGRAGGVPVVREPFGIGGEAMMEGADYAGGGGRLRRRGTAALRAAGGGRPRCGRREAAAIGRGGRPRGGGRRTACGGRGAPVGAWGQRAFVRCGIGRAAAPPAAQRPSAAGTRPAGARSLPGRSGFGLLLTLTISVLASACGAGDGRTPLIVYSPHGRDMLEAFEQRFEALHPGVDVQWIDMGSQEVLDRLRSEKANPQADVWWGAPSAMFEDAAAEGLLEAYTPSWADALPADAKDAE